MPASYRFPSRSPLTENAPAPSAREEAAAAVEGAPALWRFILGLDQRPQPLGDAEMAALEDPAALLLFVRGKFPLTLNALLAALAETDQDPGGVPHQMVFLAGDGGQIEWSPGTEGLDRLFRLVISRGGKSPFDLLISAPIHPDSATDFLQVIGWDERHGHFNYYERNRQTGQWGWAGNSWHALQPPSRGAGPFDSHVNGSLVMKELKAPWLHWHTMAAGIPETSFARHDAFLRSAFFTNRLSAHLLESQVLRPGIRAWTKRRWEKSSGAGFWNDPAEWMRHLLVSTTVNLVTSQSLAPPREQPAIGRLDLPLGFFLNAEALLDVLGLQPAFADDDTGMSLPGMDRETYRALLNRYGVHLLDEASGLRVDRDTHFAFLAPEAAFEDNVVLEEILRPGRLGRRFAACLLMTDFANPCFSARRAALMAHVPAGETPIEQIELAFVNSARAAAATADSPEAEFMAWYDHADWEAAMSRRLDEYMTALRGLLATPEGADAVFRLAESRRRSFRRRKLAEFRLTTPVLSIPEESPPLIMTAAASVMAGAHAAQV